MNNKELEDKLTYLYNQVTDLLDIVSMHQSALEQAGRVFNTLDERLEFLESGPS